MKIQEKSKINIFEIPFYINTETLIKMETKSEKKNNLHTTIELENLTKKLIPDYNFDTFDTKGFKKINEDLEKNDNEEDRDSHENETINDERCKKFSLEITHNSRNIIMRTKEQEENRRNLPIYLKETEIMDSINNNFVTIICGETGSGLKEAI